MPVQLELLPKGKMGDGKLPLFSQGFDDPESFISESFAMASHADVLKGPRIAYITSSKAFQLPRPAGILAPAPMPGC